MDSYLLSKKAEEQSEIDRMREEFLSAGNSVTELPITARKDNQPAKAKKPAAKTTAAKKSRLMPATTPPWRIMRLPTVKDRTGLGRTTIYELMKRGDFPKSRRIAGARAVGWDSLEIEAWIAKQLES